jgi:hypothetical protein
MAEGQRLRYRYHPQGDVHRLPALHTASVYGNERALGRAIKESGIPRQELFIVSKVWDTEQGGARRRPLLKEATSGCKGGQKFLTRLFFCKHTRSYCYG